MANHTGTRKLEIFCGTGGVGKTTLAASRALFLSQQGRQVLLMTIDPSKRLKEVLSISDQHFGKIANISFYLQQNTIQLDALLMSPQATLQRVVQEHSSSDGQITNRILQILGHPFGGLNETLALLELERALSNPRYNSIILDTPPQRPFYRFPKKW